MDAGLIQETDIPERIRKELGNRNGDIIHSLVIDVIEASRSEEEIRLSPDKFELINLLKTFNYQKIYLHPCLKEYEFFCRKILGDLFRHLLGLMEDLGGAPDRYAERPILLDRSFGKYQQKMRAQYQSEKALPHRVVTDYISGMTDLYALNAIRQITLPAPLQFPGA